ncbi:Transcription factor domain-containing protein [[Candida] zeylanoides]
MFVFPAFDANYNTRARVFRQCERCRAKKTKCRPAGGGGCAPCAQRRLACSLAERPPSPQPAPSASAPPPPLAAAPVGALPDAATLDMRTVTPLFLKQHFNFTVSGMSDTRGYSFVFHGHPKAVIGGNTADKSYWHESGVHVDYEHAPPSPGHIRDRRTYQYLVAINAFSITSGEYGFTAAEMRQLIDLYFAKINSVFPIVNTKPFWEEYAANTLPSIMLYTVVLVIAKDSLAQPLVRQMLARGRRVATPAALNAAYLDFIRELELKVRQLLLVLPQLGDHDKLTRLAASMLLSLHFGYDRFGNEQASQDLTNAINLALSMGIHMKRQIVAFDADKIEHLNNLWWICFVFDRVNAIVNCKSLFIRLKDFNVDPPRNPNLLKLTHAAKSLEHMLSDIYRPFKRDTLKPRTELYNMDEFQKAEFDECSRQQARAHGGVETYVASTVSLLTRLIKNVTVLAAQKSKYDNPDIPNHVPDAIALHASQNILWFVLHQQESMMINIPVVPWCLSLAMAQALKWKAREVLHPGAVSQPSTGPGYHLEDFLETLDRYAPQWWVVDEICKLSREFDRKLEGKRAKRAAPEPAVKRLKPAPGDIAADAVLVDPSLGASYDDYFGSLQMDLFDNFFTELPVFTTPSSDSGSDPVEFRV